MGGSNNAVTMYSREGVKLTEVARKKSWVWCVDTHGDSDTMALGSNGGAIDFMKIDFEPVHALFRDRFAYRENLTEVIVHHLVTDKKVRIKCKDLIHNLSLFKNKLAVQLSDRVCIYESSLDDSTDMHFRLRKEKISIVDHRDKIANTTKSHNLMIITSLYLIFSAGNVIELYAFDGQRQKFWTVDAQVTCMRIDGGSEGKEGVLAGLSNGAIIKFYVDNPFIIEVSQRGSAIAQLDINVYRTLIAYVDANNLMSVIDLHTQEVLYTTPGVIYACFNTEVEDLICITSLDSSISVVSGFHSASTGKSSSGNAPSLDVQEQHIFGLALGFRSQKIFCLNKGSIVGVDVPQGYNIQRALENNDIPTAYKIACLGATEADWKMLGMKSLRANYLHIAKNAFARLKDTKFLSLIDNIERTGPVIQQQKPKPVVPETKNDAPTSRRNRLGLEPAPSRTTTSQYPTLTIPPLDSSWVAEMLAYEGHHQEAAKLYARSGKLREAIRLFTDLRQWEDAKMFARNAGQADVSELTVQQANWLQEINDWKGSSELFITMGQFMPAAKIIVENQDEGWQDALIEVVRACPADNIETLDYCGEKFAAFNETVYARETYAKSKDVSKLMALYAKRHMWNEAAKLADENEGKFDVSIFLSYAEWLVSQDRYMEAIQAFKKSNRIDLACNVLLELAENAVAENRFKDAAYYFWLLSKEADLQQEQQEKEQQQAYDGKDEFGDKKSKKLATQRLLVNHYDYVHKADLYFAYANVHTYVTDPFTSHQPEMLFQVSRFIINSLGSSEIIPNGISKANTLYTLARQSMALGAFKLARHAYDRLSKLQMTDRKTEEIEIDMLLVQAKPVRDSPDHLPVCYRCSSTNPLLNPFTNKYAKGDVCTNCGHPFVRSFINFDILPLVEFVPEPAISDEEAIELIRQPPASKGNPFYSSMGSATGNESKAGGWKESKQSGAEMLTFDGPDGGEYGEADVIGDDDQFTKCVNFTLEKQVRVQTLCLLFALLFYNPFF